MPYWARLWPSGVALGDVAIERRDELAGRRVLELGCGLGTTATALLEAGAILTVSDYAALPLAFCRFNALRNTGRAPRTLRFNWRAPEAEALLRAELGGGFPLILAADVLYEGRDVEPFLRIVDRILAPDGQLWLAEPGRKTAQRFLNTAASIGWQGVSRHVNGPWPDGSADTISLHFLRRPTYLDQMSANLGGWRT
jgi:predicted nicotinamide N-methyase